MVDRLYDQNEGLAIPAEFNRSFAEKRIGHLSWPSESARVSFGEGGWSRVRIPPQSVAGGLRTSFGGGDKFIASCSRLDPGLSTDVISDAGRATSVHVASGSGKLILGTAEEVRRASPPSLAARAGDLFLVAPGAHYGFLNDGQVPLVVAEHSIEPAVAFV